MYKFRTSGNIYRISWVSSGNTAEQYSTAAGTGVYGVAYSNLFGDAVYISSTNGGTTWSAPTTIWQWSPIDSLGVLRGIDITYVGNVPQVVFGLAKIDPITNSYFPFEPSKVMFWSPGVNGGIPVKIDSAGGLSFTDPDVFVSVCKPVIGSSAAGNFLYATYCKARSETLNDNHFFDVYVTCSETGGASWSAPYKLTNQSGPLVDCRYPSISNKNGLYNGAQAVNILYQKDSIPSSSINGAPASIAKMMYARVTNLSCTFVGISDPARQIPGMFVLKQNFPNPFNPETEIGFEIPVRSYVKLTIYSVSGEVVDVLTNSELDAGNYDLKWNAAAYASGVYFYELKAGGFTETKKMIVIK